MKNRRADATVKDLRSTAPRYTRQLGQRLGKLLEPGDVVALSGPLGAGKTVLVKGIAAGFGVTEEVTSPSFNIVIEYRGRGAFYHVDYYRLREEAEAIEVGVEEYICSEGVTVIEWAERFPGLLPLNRLEMELSFGEDDEERLIRLRPFGGRMEKIAELL